MSPPFTLVIVEDIPRLYETLMIFFFLRFTHTTYPLSFFLILDELDE